MGKQLDSFKTSLEDFAGKYKQEIKKNPEFRGHFQQMCARIGVDPLACMFNNPSLSVCIAKIVRQGDLRKCMRGEKFPPLPSIC